MAKEYKTLTFQDSAPGRKKMASEIDRMRVGKLKAKKYLNKDGMPVKLVFWGAYFFHWHY